MIELNVRFTNGKGSDLKCCTSTVPFLKKKFDRCELKTVDFKMGYLYLRNI